MPIPKPSKTEKKSEFIARCAGDPVMNKEYPDAKQKLGICYSQWKNKKEKASLSYLIGDEEYIVTDTE